MSQGKRGRITLYAVANAFDRKKLEQVRKRNLGQQWQGQGPQGKKGCSTLYAMINGSDRKEMKSGAVVAGGGIAGRKARVWYALLG
jgi:hypothetical protein